MWFDTLKKKETWETTMFEFDNMLKDGWETIRRFNFQNPTWEQEYTNAFNESVPNPRDVKFSLLDSNEILTWDKLSGHILELLMKGEDNPNDRKDISNFLYKEYYDTLMHIIDNGLSGLVDFR